MTPKLAPYPVKSGWRLAFQARLLTKGMNMKLLRLFALLLAALLTAQQALAASKGKILVLLSSETVLPLKDGKTYQTGYFLNEFGVPADALLKAGYELEIVTPKGNVPAADPNSANPRYFANSQAEMQRIEGVVGKLVQQPLPLAKVLAGNLDQYAGLFIPGGHGPLIDLANNPQVGALLRYFHAAGKPTAAICHGPITLLSGQADPAAYEAALVAGKPAVAQNWIYSGYRMTIFSTPEEEGFESSLNGAKIRYYPAAAMKTAGGKTEFAAAWQSNVVVDRELITGQNPFSDHALARAMLEKLQAR
jgi:putative intracellular protease/amidase